MATRLADLESSAMRLPADRRTRLAQGLVASLDAEREVFAQWIAKATQDLDAYDRGEIDAAPMEQVLAKGASQLARRGAST